MTDHRDKTDMDRVAEEAAGWVARLQSSDATDEDRRKFAEWLERDPAHRDAFNEFNRLWGDLKDIPVPPDQLKKLKRARRRTTVSKAAGLAVLVLLSTAMIQMGYLDRIRADYYTTVGEVRSIVLTDGTRVDLNTNTAIIVDYSENERRVQILRGEAFFDVARNPQRPFIADEGALTAQAVGTQYSMRAADGQFRGDVLVEEGQVAVRSGGTQVLVQAGSAATLTASGDVTVTPLDVSSATAWRTGKLVFSGRPLREVLTVLSRYRHGHIYVVDDAAAEQRVSGIFDLNDTDEALREIESSLPVSVTALPGVAVVVRSKAR
ncbi:FecR family protein [Hyphomicrobium sp. D-2]|uniref:FecR family protein n=1 Tax=Hyphomicrobium sp. D-2 TaxID=3041621 RepID=UPI002453C718|nr:FecR family protein [Hyphomicrobium sp. D-2]MDH4982421.1 FecR family protein [Hyphomicrobium sp. D-2]